MEVLHALGILGVSYFIWRVVMSCPFAREADPPMGSGRRPPAISD